MLDLVFKRFNSTTGIVFVSSVIRHLSISRVVLLPILLLFVVVLEGQSLSYTIAPPTALIGKVYTKEDSVGSTNLEKAGTKEDSVRILNLLSHELNSSNPEKAKQYAREAIKIAARVGFMDGLAKAHNGLGVAFNNEGLEPDSALYHFNIFYQLLLQMGDTLGALGAQNNMAVVYRKMGDLNKAIEIYQSILSSSVQKNDLPGMARYNNNLGNAYEAQGHYSSALECYTESRRIYEQLDKKYEIAVSNFNIAMIYDRLGRHNDALHLIRKYLQYCIDNNNKPGVASAYNNIGTNHYRRQSYDSAAYYYQKSLLISQEIGDFNGLAITYDNLSAVLIKSKSQYDSAFAYVERSIRIHEHGKDSIGLASAYTHLGSIQMNIGAYDKAIESYLKANAILQGFESPSHKLEVLRELSNAYEHINEPVKALEYAHQLQSLEDSMSSRINSAFRQEITLNETRHRAAILSLQVKKRNIVIWALSVGFLLMLGLLFAIMQANRQRHKRMEEEGLRLKAEQIGLKRKHELDKLLKDQELKSIGQVLEAQENERKRIAQDLHDRLGSMLSMIKVHFLNTEENIHDLQERNQEEYDRAINLLDEACEEVRRISHNLVSGVLKNFGLSAALEELKDALQNIGKLDVEVIIHNMDERLNYDSEVNVYRIIQECVNNVLRHANATYVGIQVIRDNNKLKAMVEDNGVGFDPELLNGKKGIGLKNIQSRVVRLKGTFKLDSTPGKGTTIIVTTPIPRLHDTSSNS